MFAVLGIILSILKFIGIALLCILALIVILILLVLFSPINYKAKILYDKKAEITFKASYIFRIFVLNISYKETLDYSFKIFGFKYLPKSKKEEASDESFENFEHDYEEDVYEHDVEDKTYNTDNKEEPISYEEAVRFEPKEYEVKAHKKKKKKRKKIPFNERIKDFFRKIKRKFKNISKRNDRILRNLRDERHAAALRTLWELVIKLLKHILPRKIRGNVKFGFEDPATTGDVLVYVSLFYPMYYRSVKLVPVFNENIMLADLDIKGRIGIYYLIYIVLKLYLDKNIMRLYSLYKKKKLF